MRRALAALSVLALLAPLVGLAPRAHAEEPTPPRRHGLDAFVELAALMTKRDAAPLRQVDFTDLTLARVGVRYSLLDRVEIFGATTIVAKQPGDVDESVWQHADLMLRSQRLGPLTLSATGTLGRLMGDAGLTWSAGGRVAARKPFNELATLEGAIGGGVTSLRFDAAAGGARPWFADVTARAELQFRFCSRCTAMMWLGVGFRFPVADGGPRGARAADAMPESSAGMDAHLGFVAPLNRRWQVYSIVEFRDRGDAEVPRSEWPVLDGGFDQTQLSLGLIRRFDFGDGDGADRDSRGFGDDDDGDEPGRYQSCASRGDCSSVLGR